MKDIVIISNFAMLASENENCRFHDIAERLGQQAEVELVMSSFYHAGKHQREETEQHEYYRETLIMEPGYPKNVCLKRFYSHYRWGRNVLRYIRCRKKPDVIYCAVPSLTAASGLAKYCEREQIKFVIDIQDLWPEAFEMIIPLPFIFTPFRYMANRIYRHADYIAAVSETYIKRAMRVNMKKIDATCVFLGSAFEANNRPLRQIHFGVNVAYIGTVGASYDLKCMIDALELCYQKGYQDITGYIIGDGPDLEEIKLYAEKKPVPVTFTGRLSYENMIQLLEKCDIAVNPIRHGSAASIINKVGDYAVCGLPVVNSQESEEYRKLVEEWQCGYNCRNGDAADMAEKIMMLYDCREERFRMGENNRKLAETKFNRNVTYPVIVENILKL